MHASDLRADAADLAQRLHREGKQGRITRVDIETIRAAVAGYHIGQGLPMSTHEIEDMENHALRKFVEMCP